MAGRLELVDQTWLVLWALKQMQGPSSGELEGRASCLVPGCCNLILVAIPMPIPLSASFTMLIHGPRKVEKRERERERERERDRQTDRQADRKRK